MWKARVTFHNCCKKGHIAQESPEGTRAAKEKQLHANIKEEGSNEKDIDQGKKIFVQKRERGVVSNNWLLLDSQSMVDQIANLPLLKNE